MSRARLLELGCYEISLGAPSRRHTRQGGGDDRDRSRALPREQLAVHFHDTYGQALANILAALESGIASSTVRSPASALPLCRGASGNVQPRTCSTC